MEARRVFADMMAKSRERHLTEPDRRRLAQARQLLRRAKRPAMNKPQQTVKARHADVFIHNATRLHWTENQRWINHKTKEVVTAEELLRRYGDYLRVHRISLIDRPRDFSVVMDDGTVWSRTTDLRQNPRIKPGWTYSKLIGTHWRFPKWVLTDPQDKAHVNEDTFIARVTTVADGGKRATFTAPWGNLGWLDFADGKKVKEPRRNPIELGYRSKKTGRGRHLSIGVGRSQSNPRRRITRLGRALEVRYKREIGDQPGFYKHAIRSRAGAYAIPPGWVYVGTKSILITEKEPHV